MSFRAFRDAVIADIKANLVATTAEPLRPFLQVAAAPRRIDEHWLQHAIRKVPSVHVAWIGSARGIDRNHMGELIGPWMLVAHVVTGGRAGTPAETLLLDKLHALAAYIEGATFGYTGAGVAMVSEVENLWDIDVDKEGYALGSISWMQEVPFGRNLWKEFELGLGPFDQNNVPIDLPPDLPNPSTLDVQLGDGDPTQEFPQD